MACLKLSVSHAPIVLHATPQPSGVAFAASEQRSGMVVTVARKEEPKLTVTHEPQIALVAKHEEVVRLSVGEVCVIDVPTPTTAAKYRYGYITVPTSENVYASSDAMAQKIAQSYASFVTTDIETVSGGQQLSCRIPESGIIFMAVRSDSSTVVGYRDGLNVLQNFSTGKAQLNGVAINIEGTAYRVYAFRKLSPEDVTFEIIS